MSPFLLSPAGKDYIWGGERLKSSYGKAIDLTPLAETWECSVHPDGPSRVAEDTPPAFIMANSDDDLVPCENSIRYYEALRAYRVPAALHIYPTGGHGWADNLNFAYRSAWMGDLKVWLSAFANQE